MPEIVLMLVGAAPRNLHSPSLGLLYSTYLVVLTRPSRRHASEVDVDEPPRYRSTVSGSLILEKYISNKMELVS